MDSWISVEVIQLSEKAVGVSVWGIYVNMNRKWSQERRKWGVKNPNPVTRAVDARPSLTSLSSSPILIFLLWNNTLNHSIFLSVSQVPVQLCILSVLLFTSLRRVSRQKHSHDCESFLFPETRCLSSTFSDTRALDSLYIHFRQWSECEKDMWGVNIESEWHLCSFQFQSQIRETAFQKFKHRELLHWKIDWLGGSIEAGRHPLDCWLEFAEEKRLNPKLIYRANRWGASLLVPGSGGCTCILTLISHFLTSNSRDNFLMQHRGQHTVTTNTQ